MNQETSSEISKEPKSPASNASSPRRGRWIWLLAITVLLLLIVAAIVHRRKKHAAIATQSTSPTAVTVVPSIARKGDIGVYLNAIGTVTPVYSDSITAQVTGVITAVHYREGEEVRKGAPLIDIDPRPYAAQLGEARGELKRDENLLAQAQMDLNRYRDAWRRNVIARQQLEDQEKLVSQEQGTVQYDQSLVQYAEVELSYCRIDAPIDGRIGLRLVDPGNLVTANSTTTLLTITQMRPITVVFTLAEDNLPEVRDEWGHRQPLTVLAFDRAQQKLLGTGKLSAIDNQIDTTTGTVKLRATFDNRDEALFPNQFVNTKLLIATLHNQVLVPSSSIQHNGETAFVFLLKDGKAHMQTVKVGASDNGVTAVQGIQPGDVEANSSFEKLQDGSPVEVIRTATSPDGNAELGIGNAQ